MLLVNHSDLGIWSPFTIQHLSCSSFPQTPTAAFARVSTEFWSVSHFLFHNSCFVTCACFLLSKEQNQKHEPDLWTGKCKKQWSQAKIFLLRNSKGTDELFLVLSEETEDADSSWHRHLQMLALNSANYLVQAGASWLFLQSFIDKLCLSTYPDQDTVGKNNNNKTPEIKNNLKNPHTVGGKSVS